MRPTSEESFENLAEGAKTRFGEDFVETSTQVLQISSSSLIFVIFNFTNCVVGSGIVSLPYSMMNAGLPLGLIVLTFSAMMTSYTLLLLVNAANKFNIYNYVDLVEHILGWKISFVVGLCHITFPMFISMSYGIAIADNLENFMIFVAKDIPILQNRILILLCVTLTIILPLSMARKVAFLEKASALSIFCVIFYTSVFVVRSFTITGKTFVSSDTYSFSRTRFVQAIASLYFAMTPHHNLFQLYTSLKNRSFVRFSHATHSTIGISSIIYYIVSAFGFATFGGVLRSNLINNYCNDDLLISISRLVFALSIIFTYPLQMLASREMVLLYLSKKIIIKWYHRVIVSTTLVVICVTVACICSSAAFGPVVEIGGALTAAPMATIVPTMIFIKSAGPFTKNFGVQKGVACFVCLVGITAMLLGTILSLINGIKGSQSLEISKYWCA